MTFRFFVTFFFATFLFVTLRFLATFFFATLRFLVTFLFVTFLLVTFLLVTFLLVTFFLATFLLVTFFLAFFLAFFFAIGIAAYPPWLGPTKQLRVRDLRPRPLLHEFCGLVKQGLQVKRLFQVEGRPQFETSFVSNVGPVGGHEHNARCGRFAQTLQ